MVKKTIILTGANGWLGKGIFSALLGVDKNYAVNVSDQINYPIRVVIGPSDTEDFFKTISSDLVKIYKADIRDMEQLRSVFEEANEGVLLHTAGVIHPKRIQDFYDVNEFGTKNLLDLATMFNLSKAVILSSNSPIGCNPFPDHVFDEESPYNPYMNYGNSKKKMELLVNKYYSEGKINTVIIRAPWFYGPFQPERQTLFFEMIRDGKGPIVGSGRNMRSMAYIDNLVQGVLLAALSDVANGQT
ncbi:MAG: NAD(P)-dependent oxidoreductase, partial [Thiotrichales bacterium]|nr:NAD(P)-dependent oxidoreductase [Thiotrichales bacterium]